MNRSKENIKYILGVETSCDETSAAVLLNGREILSNVIATQFDVHAAYGGVVPELASRSHMEAITAVVERALHNAGLTIADIGAVAVTVMPGLIGSLAVGLSVAKGIAYERRIPLVGVNHIEGHLNAAFIEHSDIKYPYLGLVVSGGHTSIYHVKKFGEYKLLGATRDDAAGEAFDKVAKLLGLGYPGGPVIENIASTGDETAFGFTTPKLNVGSKFQKGKYDFSFSGIKTAVLNYSKAPDFDEKKIPDLVASFQCAVAKMICKNVERVLEDNEATGIIFSGGVAANKYIKVKLGDVAKKMKVALYVPSMRYCTDNAAMIAYVGHMKFASGKAHGWDLNVDSTKGM